MVAKWADGTAMLTISDMDEMVSGKNDLEFQVALCRRIMASGAILPFPFDRATVLPKKAKMHDLALELCDYVQKACDTAKENWDGNSAMIWKSPKLQKCINRLKVLKATSMR